VIVLGLLAFALSGASFAIQGHVEANWRRRVLDGEGTERAEQVSAWGATAAVFFLVLALLIWVVQ